MMFGADVETIAEDEEYIVMRISWFAGNEHYEKWIEARKDELED